MRNDFSLQVGMPLPFSFLYAALLARAKEARIKSMEKIHCGNPIKHTKWHLGIRSQSKLQDSVNEVYLAMKTLNYVNTLLPADAMVSVWEPHYGLSSPLPGMEGDQPLYQVHVRCKKGEEHEHHVKMSLQLYQVNGTGELFS